MKILLVYLVIINISSLIVYGIDKYQAAKHLWRIPERTLLLLAAVGGSYGAFLGMLIWHHKTQKWTFRIFVPLLMVLWAVLIFWGYRQ